MTLDPIIGQACTVKSVLVQTLVACTCLHRPPLLLVQKSVAQCPACRRKLRNKAIDWSIREGQRALEVEQVILPGALEPAVLGPPATIHGFLLTSLVQCACEALGTGLV